MVGAHDQGLTLCSQFCLGLLVIRVRLHLRQRFFQLFEPLTGTLPRLEPLAMLHGEMLVDRGDKRLHRCTSTHSRRISHSIELPAQLDEGVAASLITFRVAAVLADGLPT